MPLPTSPTTAPLSAAERLAWRATGWLLTGACGALTAWGLADARSAAPVAASAPVVASAVAPSAAPAPATPTAGERAPATEPARRRRCG